MARQVTVQLSVDSKGAVQGIEAVNGELVDLSEVSERVGQDLRTSFQGLQNRAALAEQGLEGVEIQARQTATAANQIAGSGQRANQVLFTFGQAAQDAAFGLQFAINNMPMLIQQFQQLQSESGGTFGALGQLKNAVTGFGAAILAINLIPLITNLISFTDATEEAKDAQEDLNEAMDRFFQIQDDLEDVRFESLEAAERALDQMETSLAIVEEELGKVEAQMELGTATAGALSVQMGSSEASMGAMRQTAEGLREEQERLQEQIEKTRQEIDARREARQQQVQAEAFGATVTEDSTESNEDLEDAEEDLAQAIERTKEAIFDQTSAADQLLERFQRLADAQRNLRDLSQDTESMMPGRDELEEEDPFALFDLEEFADILGGPALDSINEVDRALANLRDRLGEATSEEQRSRIREVITLLEEFKQAGEGAGDGTVSIGEALSNFDVTALTMAASAMGQIASGAKEADQAVQDLVANLARAAGASLIQAGRFEIGIPLLLGGELVGAFEHGGGVDTPFQIVGEGGAELATLPRGSRVHSNQESREIISDSLRQMLQPVSQAARQGGGTSQRLIQEVKGLREDTRAMRQDIANLERVMPIDELEKKRRKFINRREEVGGGNGV